MDQEQPLEGGNVDDVVRVGDTVHRTAGPWTPTIHALLRHVRAAGVACVPEALGIDEQGREVLSWLPGEVGGWPVPDWVWSAQTRAEVGAMLRAVHDASVDFSPADAVWRSPAHEPQEVVCLNDAAPRDRLVHLLASYGDAAPPLDDVVATMVVRLHELADWTDDHARTLGRADLLEHAAMYRRDATRLTG